MGKAQYVPYNESQLLPQLAYVDKPAMGGLLSVYWSTAAGITGHCLRYTTTSGTVGEV